MLLGIDPVSLTALAAKSMDYKTGSQRLHKELTTETSRHYSLSVGRKRGKNVILGLFVSWKNCKTTRFFISKLRVFLISKTWSLEPSCLRALYFELRALQPSNCISSYRLSSLIFEDINDSSRRNKLESLPISKITRTHIFSRTEQVRFQRMCVTKDISEKCLICILEIYYYQAVSCKQLDSHTFVTEFRNFTLQL